MPDRNTPILKVVTKTAQAEKILEEIIA